MLSTPPAFVLSQDQTLRQELLALLTRRLRTARCRRDEFFEGLMPNFSGLHLSASTCPDRSDAHLIWLLLLSAPLLRWHQRIDRQQSSNPKVLNAARTGVQSSLPFSRSSRRTHAIGRGLRSFRFRTLTWSGVLKRGLVMLAGGDARQQPTWSDTCFWWGLGGAVAGAIAIGQNPPGDTWSSPCESASSARARALRTTSRRRH